MKILIVLASLFVVGFSEDITSSTSDVISGVPEHIRTLTSDVISGLSERVSNSSKSEEISNRTNAVVEADWVRKLWKASVFYK